MFDYGSFRGKSSSSSSWLKRQQQSLQQEKDSADLVKKINLMVERKEPLDKIAKDLNVDYEALKQSVSKINPKYEQEVKASKRSLLESAAAFPGEAANWFVEDLIKKEIIDPAVEGFTAAEKVRRAQEAVGDMNRLDILKKNREFNRKQLFGDEAKWTAAQRNDKNFIAKVQKYDTETQQKLANFSKKIDYNAIKESSELDPLKTAGAISQTFLNVASAGFFAPAKAASTAIAKQTAGLAGREIAKKQATELTEQELKKAASKLTVKRNKEIAKVIGTELAKDVPFGAAYGVAYTARNVDDPTFKDYLENSLIGGAFAAPFSIAGPLLSKATKNRMTKKAQKLFVENAQQLYNQRQKILVASGLKSRAQARLDVKEYNVAIKKAAKDMDISGFQGNIGQTVSEQPLTNLRTGTTKQVTKAEAEQAAEIASRRAAGEVAEDVTKQVDTAAIETAEAAADEAALPVIDDRINTIEAIPEAQRTAQQSVDLGKARMQRDAVLNRVAERAKRAQVGVPEAPGAARLGRPVTPTGVAPEIIQARQAPIVSRAQALEEVPLQREPTVPGQQPLSVKDLKGFNKFSSRINKLTAELEKTKIREQKYGRTRDTLRVSQLERLIRGLKAQPAYRNIASRVGLEDELGALGDIVDQAYDLAVKNDGVTISLGGKIPTNGVAFSPYKEFETRIKIEDFSKEDVQTFVDRNMDVLNQDGNNIGLWVEGGDMMIDVSRVVELDEAAIKAAQSNEQLAMWDIARGKEIRIGQEQNGVYSVVDEASNIFNKYKEEAPTAGGGRGVGELREVREGEQARGEKTPRAAKEEVATAKEYGVKDADSFARAISLKNGYKPLEIGDKMVLFKGTGGDMQLGYKSDDMRYWEKLADSKKYMPENTTSFADNYSKASEYGKVDAYTINKNDILTKDEYKNILMKSMINDGMADSLKSLQLSMQVLPSGYKGFWRRADKLPSLIPDIKKAGYKAFTDINGEIIVLDKSAVKKLRYEPKLEEVNAYISNKSTLGTNQQPQDQAPEQSFKEKQLEIIKKSNPAQDDIHTWIRSVDDIQTLKEALSSPEYADYNEYMPDYTKKMAEEAIKSGKIEVFSSYPIKDGIFVTPSKMEAESYSGDGKVYSKTININDIAWIDPTQGQVADISRKETAVPKTLTPAENKIYSEIKPQLDTDQKFLDELNSLTQVGRVSGDMLDKLNEFVSRGIESVIRPFKELPPDAKARQWYDSFVRNFQDNTAGVVKVIAEGVRKGVISRDELTNVLEEMSSVKRAFAPAIHFWNNSQNYQKLIAPIEGKTLSGKRLDDLNEYIVARTELNLMNIDKVDNPARKAKFERIIKQYESPEYKERYDALVAYHDELLTKLVDSGIVSQEKANLWRNTNQEYVRVQRVMDDIVQRREAGTRQIASFRTTKAEQRRKGSTKEAQNLIYVAVERAQQVFEEIARNNSANAVVNALKKLGEDYADPVRLAENVYVRNSLKESLALSRPLKVALNRFVKSQSKYVARISKEVDDLNMQGLNTYLRQGAKDKKQINLTSKVKILQDVDPDVPLQSLKNAGKWRGGNAPDLDTVKSAMARTRYRNGVTGAYTPALKAYAKRNGLSEDEALVRLYMAEKRFDGYEFNGKEFIINDKKLAKEAGDMLVRGEIKGKVRGATATETRMGLRNTVDAVDNIISYPTSQLLAVKRKLANREPKLAQAIDELVSLKSQVDELNATRRAEWEEIVRRSDAEIAGKPTIARRVNGIDEVYTTTPEIEAAVKLAGPGPFQGLINFLNPWTRALTATVTGPLNPAYAIKALIRDQFESVVLSRNVQATHDPKNIIGAIAESVKNDDLFRKFMETEGSSSARIDYIRKPQSAARLIREQSRLQLPPVVKTAKLMTDPVALWRKIEDVSRWQEILYRWQNFRGVYDYAIKSGKSEAEALVEARYAARNNMVDFFRGGDYSPLFNALYPYFNASIQGGVQLGREFRDRPVTTSIKVFTAVQIPTIVTTMYNLSDPRRAEIYFDLSQYERDNNWILILPGSEKTDGRWETIKIPKPPGVGGFSNPIQKTLEGMYGFDPVEFMDFVQAFAQVSGSPFRVGSVNEFTGSLIPQQIKPTISAVANYDFFFGKPIVPEWMKAQEPDPTKQAFENTSFTAQQIGKAIGVSPLNVEKFLRDTLGETSRYGIYGLDTASVALGIAPESQVGGKNPLTGLLQNLYTSPGGAVNAKVRDRVDNLLNTKNSISKDINELLKVEDYAAANRLAATYNFEVDAILEANYDRPEFVRTAMKQLEYLESLKFPMEDGYLTDASIKARLKRLQKRELE